MNASIMDSQYHMIVIGAGSGGLSMALGLHELGLKVLLIDKSDRSIGGECLNTGCVPSKAFIHASKVVGTALKSLQFGLEIEGQPSMSKIWQYVTEAQEKIRSHENASFFRQQGLDVVLGTARFTGKNTVSVNGQEYSGKKITIATGSKPRKLQVPGVDLVRYYDNENIWEIEQLPSKMLFIGAGPINMELGQAFSRLGSKVTMVEMADNILLKEDPDIAEILLQKSAEMGIVFHLQTKLSKFKDARTAVIDSPQGIKEINFDALVVGIGREIDLSELNLDAANVQLDTKGKLVVDPYQRTTNKNVLVIGDAAGGPQFSHAAELQATTMIGNLFSPLKSKIKYDKFSWVTFTEPEVATFGLSESQLARDGTPYEKLTLDFDEDDRAVAADYQYGKLVVYISRGRFFFSNPKILGGSMVAPNAGEMIQELILAQSKGLGINSIFNKIYPYPTGSRVNKTIVLNKYRELLKPWMVWIMKKIY